MSKLELIVWSDYLCPWCHQAAHRLEGIREEFGGRLELTWRSFLLRPEPGPVRELEKFRRYTESWRRPASEDDSAEFRVWQTDFGPPSHSVPPHIVAKAASRLGAPEFERMHQRLLRAYFVENLDVSDPATLRSLWVGLGLDSARFPELQDAERIAEVLAEHEAALQAGVTGVPAFQIAGDEVVITGAHPRELYRRWIRRRLEAPEADAEGAGLAG